MIGVWLGLRAASALAQNGGLGGLNHRIHVGMAVDRFDEVLAFYTRQVGFHEAFTIRDEKGQPTLSYIRFSRDMFVELRPSNINRPPGFTHFGVHVQDVRETVASLRQRGVTIEEPRTAYTDSTVARATGPGGIRIEIVHLTPESL